jgi:hypothetical protein
MVTDWHYSLERARCVTTAIPPHASEPGVALVETPALHARGAKRDEE